MKPRTLEQKKKSRKAYMLNKKFTANNPNKGEWIAMRLLYLMLASDTSSINIDDVKRTIEYFNNRFVDKEKFSECMEKLRYEHGLNKTFVDNPESKLIRDIGRSLTLTQEQMDFSTKHFGTTGYTLKPGTTNE